MTTDLGASFESATKLNLVVERIRFFDRSGVSCTDENRLVVASFKSGGMSQGALTSEIQNLIEADILNIQNNPIPLGAEQTVNAAEYLIHAEGKFYPLLRITLLRSEGHLDSKDARTRLIANVIRAGNMEAEYADVPLKLGKFVNLPVLESVV